MSDKIDQMTIGVGINESVEFATGRRGWAFWIETEGGEYESQITYDSEAQVRAACMMFNVEVGVAFSEGLEAMVKLFEKFELLPARDPDDRSHIRSVKECP